MEFFSSMLIKVSWEDIFREFIQELVKGLLGSITDFSEGMLGINIEIITDGTSNLGKIGIVDIGKAVWLFWAADFITNRIVAWWLIGLEFFDD